MLSDVQAFIREALAAGIDWDQMRANAHAVADSLGRDLAAVIKNPNVAFDRDLDKIAKLANKYRAQYAIFLDLYMKEKAKQ